MVRTLQGSVKFLVGELKSHKPPSPAKKKKNVSYATYLQNNILWAWVLLSQMQTVLLPSGTTELDLRVSLDGGQERGWGADAACRGVSALCVSPSTLLAKGVCLVSLLTLRLWILKNQLY